MNNIVTFNYNDCTVKINYDEKVKEKILIDSQLNNYQTALLKKKIDKLYDKFLYEAMSEETKYRIKVEVDNICELYLLDKLEDEKI